MASKCGKAIVPESLLAKKRFKDAHERFKLGLGDWTESSSEDESEKENQPRKKLKLSLTRRKKETGVAAGILLTIKKKIHFPLRLYRKTRLCLPSGH